MPLKKSLRKGLLLSSLLPMFLNANTDENILSQDRLKQFELSEKKVIEDSSKLKKDWINPITLSYTKIDGEYTDSEKSVISVDQPIFKSGGIYKAIKYANANEKYSNLDIDLQRKNLIKDAYETLYNINKIEFEIKKANYVVKNAQIDVIRKKEQVLNGFLDTSFLDNAILDANTAKKNLIDLKYQKNELINSFNNLASKDYKLFSLPTFELVSKKEFLNKNLELSKAKADIQTKYEYKGMTLAKYLPTVSATFDYTKNHKFTPTNTNPNDDSIHNVGISISMPLNVRTFNDIESTQIDYLKAKLSLKNKILEEQNFFKTKLEKIKTIERKIEITKDDYELYNSLLDTIVEEKNAGLKTKSDVDTLLNSSMVKKIELKVYELEKQIELLKLYAKIE
ncbi:outer membrane protein TolC [Malaciobacter marinus]|jgi:outer membrane protein TolC|uniref:Outer membrane protein TolC n=1 Tax=Malaciobacter marinus TaxID=505249 RepID=A0AB36ZXF4_9BACT|nr:outer membrane protein TolC [Malaciobacter marinus]SKB43180.1 Outer membrane protein TolC [Malaciobacter marinus]